MGIVLKNPQAVREFFYRTMAKNDLLTKIEQGDVQPKPTVLKWLHNNSSWEDRITHSGQLDSCLKGSGFAFQSFIPSSTNGKETIVILNIQRARINWIKQMGGRGYLDNFQSKAKANFVTCTLSVLVAAAPFMGKEVNNMVNQYIKLEKNTRLFPDVNTLGRRLLAEKIAEIESKYVSKVSSLGRNAAFSMINKIANFVTEPIGTSVELIGELIESTILGSEYEFKYSTAKNLIEEVATIVDKALFWVTTPALAAERKVTNIITKSTTEIRKPITQTKSLANNIKRPVSDTKTASKNIQKILKNN